jgi:hypothetical protein
MTLFAGYQNEIYLRGVAGERPGHPLAWEELERAAEALRTAQAAFAEGRHAVEGEQAELREWLEASRRERDEFRAATDSALAQLAEVRNALREQESSISVQIPSNAVEREELGAFAAELRSELGTELTALRHAEAGLRAKVEAMAGAEQAASGRLEQIAAAAEALR